MDGLIELLYSIPVLGYLFQFVGYLIEIVPSISPIILQNATPIALAALCGVLCERSGVVNIGIEGIMIAAAFVGWYVGVILQPMLGGTPSDFFGVTPTLLVALVAALLTGMLISLLHAWLSITVRADQIISGTIINIVALGVTGYLIIIISGSSPPSAGKFATFVPPQWLTDLPLVGWIFDMFLNQGPITMSVLILAIVLQVLLFRSRWGLHGSGGMNSAITWSTPPRPPKC